MRPPVVVESDPVSNGSHGVQLAFEAMPMHALLLERANDALDHPVLLWAMRGDKLLPQAIAANQSRIMATGKDQPII